MKNRQKSRIHTKRQGKIPVTGRTLVMKSLPLKSSISTGFQDKKTYIKETMVFSGRTFPFLEPLISYFSPTDGKLEQEEEFIISLKLVVR